MRKTLCLIILSCCCNIGVCEVDPSDEGDPFDMPKPTLDEVLTKAKTGNPDDIHAVGDYYIYDDNLFSNLLDKPDYEEAINWYKKSRQKGYVHSSYALGICYEGLNDYKKAFFFYKEGHSLGSIDATAALAKCYEKGLGVTKNNKKAYELYKLLSEKNISYGKVRLARCYQLGLGVEANLIKEVEVHNDIISDGLLSDKVKSWYRLGEIYFYGFNEITPDLQKSIANHTEAACYGYVPSMLRLGDISYNDTNNGFYNKDVALSWYTEAALKGDVIGQRNAAYVSLSKDDYGTAFKWAMKAALQGDASGFLILGRMYEFGLGVPINLRKACDLYSISAKKKCDPGIKAFNKLRTYLLHKDKTIPDNHEEEIENLLRKAK